MKSTILIIVVTAVLSSALTLGGFYFITPKMIKMPEMPNMEMAKMDLSQMKMPDCNEMMGSKMDEMVKKMTESMPKMSAMPSAMPSGMSSSTSSTMSSNVKSMQKAIKDMKKWAGKMEDAGNEMETIRDQMAVMCSPETMAMMMSLFQ